MRFRPLLSLGLLLGSAAAAPAVDIVQCGQTVGPGEVGELRQNLDCRAGGLNAAQGMFVLGGGTLELNGFAITGDGTGFGLQVGGGPRRRRWVTVNGPGQIASFEIAITGVGGQLRIRNLEARHNGYGLAYKVARRTIELTGVVMSDNQYGITARGARVVGTDVEASNNVVVGVRILGPTTFTRLTAVGNGTGGGVMVASGPRSPLRLVDSTITGNDGLGDGFDVLSTGRVKLRNTTCERGARIREDFAGGVWTTTVVGRLGCTADPR